MSRALALFDFDETLILENSLGALFRAVGRGRRLWWHAAPAVLGARRGFRDAIKRRLYAHFLTGQTEASIAAAGRRVAPHLTPNPPVVEALDRAVAEGHEAWVVTASPRPFVATMVEELGWPVARVIGTELPTTGGRYTGAIGVECVGVEKARRIEAALAAEPERPRIAVAFGNLPADLPMLAMASAGFAVRGSRVQAQAA